MTNESSNTRSMDAGFTAGQLDEVRQELLALQRRITRIHTEHVARLGTMAVCDGRYSEALLAAERAESAISRIAQRDCYPAMRSGEPPGPKGPPVPPRDRVG